MYGDLHLIYIRTDLNTTHERNDRSRLYRIVEKNLATRASTKWELGFKVSILPSRWSMATK